MPTLSAANRRSQQDLVPSFFEGSLSFFLLLIGWLMWTLIIPINMLQNVWLPINRSTNQSIDPNRELAYAMFLTGIAYLVYSLMPLISGGINQSIQPAASGPLTSQSIQSTNQTVNKQLRQSSNEPSKRPTNHSINPPVGQSVNQSIKQSVDQSIPGQPYHIIVKHVLAIINPYGGGKNNVDRWNREVAPLLSQHDIQVTHQSTNHEGHARDLVMTLPLDQYDCIAVVGGDGTMNEVTNGLMNRHDGRLLPVCLIPGGTGNALATDFGTLDFKKAAQRIVDGSVVFMDVMVLTSSSNIAPLHLYSIETITWGLVGNVAVEAERAVMRLLGTARFNACAVWGVMKGFLAKLTIDVLDDSLIDRSIVPIDWSSQSSSKKIHPQFSGNFVTAYINNTQYFAKLLRGAPYALIDDGKFDLLCLEPASRGELLSLFGTLPTGTHVNSPKVRYVQANHVRLTAERGGVLNVDGEVVEYEGEFEVKCIPRALPIMLSTEFVARDVPGLKER